MAAVLVAQKKEWDPATDDLIDQASFIEQRFVEHD